MECKLHPNYKAIHEPTSTKEGCKCRLIWEAAEKQAQCPGCGRMFRKGSAFKKYCDDYNCKAIRKLGKDRPVNFSGIQGKCSIYAADMDYVGPGYAKTR